MGKRVNSEVLFDGTDRLIIDVRSPKEYESGHIPGAFSLPLFSDEERAVVGTLYKQVGSNEAIQKGLEIVGPKMATLVQIAKNESNGREILVYCWRGGKRSGSVSWLLEMTGLPVVTLHGGYKAFRNWGFSQINKINTVRVLVGHTGVGKTHILEKMKQFGAQVIDLEALANHRGSAFGHIGMELQPSTEHFQNLIFHEIGKLNFSKIIWFEGESIHIGHCGLPLELYQKMQLAPFISCTRSIQERTQNILADYGTSSTQDLTDSVVRIAKKMGPQHAKTAISLIEKRALEEVVPMLLNYYDKFYEFGLINRTGECLREIDVTGKSYELIAHELIDFAIK
jgi:tRNA 2-selenouridine synthase